MPNTRETTQAYLINRAQKARDKACEMMSSGSREYDDIRRLVEEYIVNQYAADVVSGQTDTGFTDIDEPKA